MVFLTPDGSAPDHDSYISYDYNSLMNVLEALANNIQEPVPEPTKLAIRHYIDMVRRHIVQDDALRSLAITLYERHKEAFEFIFECRPEPQSLLSAVRGRVEIIEGLIIESGGGNLFRFVPENWDNELVSVKGDPAKWSRTGRGILFECKVYANNPGRVNIALILGPGDNETRSRFYEAAMAQPKLFTGIVKPMGAQYATVFSRDLLTTGQARGLTFEQQEFNVGLAWSDFQGQVLPKLMEAVLDIDKQLNPSAIVQAPISSGQPSVATAL